MRVVRISALWCMSCLLMKGRYDKVFKAYGIEEVQDLDYDLDRVDAYDPGHILPVVIIYDKDQEIKRIVGEQSKKTLNKLFSEINH